MGGGGVCFVRTKLAQLMSGSIAVLCVCVGGGGDVRVLLEVPLDREVRQVRQAPGSQVSFITALHEQSGGGGGGGGGRGGILTSKPTGPFSPCWPNSP